MLGKDEIGIIATAIKGYLLKTNVVNAAVLRAADEIRSGNIEKALEILDKYCFKIKDINGTTRLGILANINFRPLYDACNSILNGQRNHSFVGNIPAKFAEYSENSGFRTLDLLDDLSAQNANEDVLMALSALLSAATDL